MNRPGSLKKWAGVMASVRRLATALLIAASASVALPLHVATAQVFTPTDPDWQLYQRSFVVDGRVIDTGNNDISHSEGQGYGMLLAVAFDDPQAFGSLWSWTRNRIWVRDNLTSAWRWEEGERPPITDANPAADGDILIAWALIRAYGAWGMDEHADAARQILAGLKQSLIGRVGTVPVIGAGIDGFDWNGGLIVNPSYWIFPALSDIERFDNDPLWGDVITTGERILQNARFGRWDLTPDWVLIDRQSGRLSALPEEVDFLFRGFGYNAIRLPLYRLWDDPTAMEGIDPIAELWRQQGEGPVAVEVDFQRNQLVQRSDGQGYRAIRALVECVGNGAPFPAGLRLLSDGQDYYSSSLFLLTRVAVAERGLQCL